MTLEPQAHPESVNRRLADYLATQKEPLISEWLERVKEDPAIMPTAVLNTVALKNHMPELFDDLTGTLSRYGSETVAEQAVRNAGDHGATRLRQGYELPEMLRELKHFRAVLIHYLRLFEDRNPDDGMAARLFVSTTVHGFLDQLAIDATEQYLKTRMNLRKGSAGGFTRW